jgi:hypothetical protein
VGPDNMAFVKRPAVARDRDSQATLLRRTLRSFRQFFVGAAAGSQVVHWDLKTKEL